MKNDMVKERIAKYVHLARTFEEFKDKDFEYIAEKLCMSAVNELLKKDKESAVAK